MSKLKNPIQMAVIGAAHGIRGELRVKTFTGDPLALADYGPLHTKDGRIFEIVDIRPQGTVVVVRLKGVNDRNAAEALTGTELFVDRSALPEALEDDEFYHADLVGLAVKDEAGETLGKVIAVQNFGGGDILEIGLGAGRPCLFPSPAPRCRRSRSAPASSGSIRSRPGWSMTRIMARLAKKNAGRLAASMPGDGRAGPKDAGGNR